MSSPTDWDRLADEYAARSGLLPPEIVLLERLRGRLGSVQMLDLGIGAGRTTEFIAPLVRAYVGIDYSPRMVAEARRRLPAGSAAELAVADARDLSAFHGRDFDVVLFSFNGIDAVGHDDRLRILTEVRRVVADDGVFAFSTHSLRSLPLPVRFPRPARRHPLRSTFRETRRALRLTVLNRRLDVESARRQGWALIRDGAHDFSVVLYYVDPAHQLEQLAGAGFTVSEVLDMSGMPVDRLEPGHDPHLLYIARPV